MVADPRPNFFGVAPDQLGHWLTQQGERPMRVGQVLRWVFRDFADSFASMSNLAKVLRAQLEATFALGTSRRVEVTASGNGDTTKYLLAFPDAECVECVLMREARRTTLCLSSQAGCAMGCRFCATGAAGFGRNLAAAEIVEQAWRMARDAGGFTHVVFMGMGEPLRNLDQVVAAMEALVDKARFALGGRKITLSTCGIASGIRELARATVRPHLALSLNSPFEEQRREIMPGTRKHRLDRVLEACAHYAEATGRHLTLEYVLLHEVNDTRPHARALAEIARSLKARINLVAYNPVRGAPFHPPDHRDVERFQAWLRASRAEVSVRYRRGRDILAGCGQLRGAHRGGLRRPPGAGR